MLYYCWWVNSGSCIVVSLVVSVMRRRNLAFCYCDCFILFSFVYIIQQMFCNTSCCERLKHNVLAYLVVTCPSIFEVRAAVWVIWQPTVQHKRFGAGSRYEPGTATYVIKTTHLINIHTSQIINITVMVSQKWCPQSSKYTNITDQSWRLNPFKIDCTI